MSQTNDGLRGVLSVPADLSAVPSLDRSGAKLNEPQTPSSSRIHRILLALILLYPVPFMFQGLDWSDLGFLVSSYQQVFRDPASIASSFTIWLTVVIGGAWIWITGPLGLLGAKLGYVVVSGLTMFITYVTLRRAFRGSETAILGALFVAATYVYYDQFGAMNWISYNDLSALFFAWAAYHLMRGITEDRPLHLAAAGAVLALNLFVRLPNLVGAGLGLAILYNKILTKRSFGRLGREVGAFAGGYAGGVACAFLLMAALGHVGYFVSAVRSLSELAAQKNDFHGSTQLIHGWILDNVSTIQHGVYVLGLVAILYVIARGIGRIPSKVLVVVLGASAGVLLYCYDVPWLSVDPGKLLPLRWGSYTGVAYLSLLAVVLVPFRGLRERPERRTLALVALLILVMVPIGSGRSLVNAHYGMWLAIGVIGTYAFTLRARDHAVLFVQVACAVMVVTYGVLGLWRTPYRDTQDRTQLTHAVHHPKLKGIFTNQLRAQTVQQLVDVLPSYVHAGDPVIAFEYIPMIHYLTDTVPYLYNPNPMYYSAAQFSEALERALTERRELPLLVTAKGDVDIGWPSDVGRGVATSLPKFAMMRTIMERFKQRYGYVKKWENNFFEIWRPAVQLRPDGAETQRFR